MTGIVTLLNLVLSLFSTFVEWGKTKKIFKENEAIIVAAILTNAMKEIQLVKETNARLDLEFKSDTSSILRDDQFTRK